MFDFILATYGWFHYPKFVQMNKFFQTSSLQLLFQKCLYIFFSLSPLTGFQADMPVYPEAGSHLSGVWNCASEVCDPSGNQNICECLLEEILLCASQSLDVDS